jgi:ribonuclease BN (tRNA processing enzyme)
VFLTHLHSDHIADLATFYVGAMFGRTAPWHVWGPSGENAATGTAHCIEGLRQVRELNLRCSTARRESSCDETSG